MSAAPIGRFQLIEPIGQGAFGQVWKCGDRLTGNLFACKAINIRALREDPRIYENFKNELRANAQIRHPGIVRLMDVQCDNENMFLILELCQNGTLESRVRANNGLSEEEAQSVFRQLMRTIEYIHRQSYAHRDVTLKNILVADGGVIKLTDFGLCKRREESQMCTTMCGTFVYVAPEMLKCERYDAFKVDVWSAGICLYSMVTNHLPWLIDDNTPTELIWKATAEQICSGNIIYDEGMSEDLKGLLSQMLTVDPDERPTARDVLDHPWVQNTDDPNDGDEPDPNMVSFIESVISTLDSMCF